ncbi:MAG: hypothetical protein H6673_09850 [Anaerolineales bacterium]|nr:hypothetical protein [Anaerolineales bacterium]
MNDDDFSSIVIMILGAAAFVIAAIAAAIALTIAGHWVLAWGILVVSRSRPVRRWVLNHGWQRQAIQAWIWYIPVTVSIIWTIITAVGMTIIAQLPFGVAVLGAILSGSVFLGFYHHLQITHIPKSMDWIFFIEAAKGMELEERLTRIERDARFQVWLQTMWGSNGSA